MKQKEILKQNKETWDAIADSWFGTTALPEWGCSVPTEDALCLLGDLTGKTVLDIGCGSGHSMKWCAEHGAEELWGLDLSSRQLENAGKLLNVNNISCRLLNQSMEESSGIPENYFDVVYSVYAVGWTTDMPKTFSNVFSYLKTGGIFIFSWDHPFMHCVDPVDEDLIFSGNYLDEDIFSFEKGGFPVTIKNRKLSTYINALADAGFAVKRVIEETDKEALSREDAFSSRYYSRRKAAKFPLSVIIQAEKI